MSFAEEASFVLCTISYSFSVKMYMQFHRSKGMWLILLTAFLYFLTKEKQISK